VRFQIVDLKTNKVVEEDALPTMYMLADWPGRMGMAVKRGRLWYAADYPGFEMEPGEQAIRIKIREER
jgi:hypothetical protein